MAELESSDLPAALLARFADDDAAQAAIDAALAAARRWCGWHVSPVREDDEIAVDSDGGRVLDLPTMNLLEISEITENSIELDVAALQSSRRRGTVRKLSGQRWTPGYGSVVVTMTHGFTEAEAADWRRGVIRMVELATPGQRDSPDLVTKKVDDVQYQWADGLISSDEQLAALFSPFRILPSP